MTLGSQTNRANTVNADPTLSRTDKWPTAYDEWAWGTTCTNT